MTIEISILTGASITILIIPSDTAFGKNANKLEIKLFIGRVYFVLSKQLKSIPKKMPRKTNLKLEYISLHKG